MTITIFLGLVLIIAPHHSFIDWLTVAAVGLLVLALAWGPSAAPVVTRGPATEEASTAKALRRSVLLWSIAGVGFCVWEALAFVMGTVHAGDFAAFPTVSYLMDPVLQDLTGCSLFAALWLGGRLGVDESVETNMTTWIFIAGYLALLAAMAAAEIYARIRPQRLASLNQMLDFVMTSRTTRVGIIAAWWWLGWHFLFAPTV